ncbi:Leucine-rich repeat-containing protein 9, partial [Orchesella cincta]
NDKDAIWVKGVTNDSEVKAGVESLYRDAVSKQMAHGFGPNKTVSRKVQPYYLHKCGHGMKADLTAITKLVQNPVPLRGDTIEKEMVTHQLETLAKLKANVDLLRISKFLGQEIAHTVTTLDLSGNRLGLTVGLEGMNNLRRLNLSHNNLTTLSGLHKLPHLIELKASWNYLRFLHSNISTLTWATPRLTTLEILPNPFQDVRDYAHIPLLVSQALPSLHRVDIWSAPFATAPKMAYDCFLSNSLVDIESGFSHAIMANSWVLGRSLIYKEFRGKCLTNLDQLPRSPPFPDGFSINAIELDLSDNYLSSTALGVANFIRTSEWRAAVIKLNLQENCITNLDWLKDNIFPNLHILNLSNNHLQDLDMIQFACPSLIHLHLSGNPLPCNTFILAPLRHLPHLQTLEAKRTPLSSHPDYGSYVMRYIQNIQVLDGVPVANWRSEEIINHMGGTLNGEWLELNLGQRDWSALTELSLPHCGLSRVHLPPAAVPKLMSLDLTGNQLSTFSGVTSLPNLRVLCVSYNSIKSLGEAPCPTCYSHTAESRALFQKNKFGGLGPSSTSSSTSGSGGRMDSKSKFSAQSMRKSFVSKTDSGKFQSLGFRGGDKESPPYSPRGSGSKVDPPKIFPRLEVLILSHNSLSGVNDLHLHCLPRLQTLMLNCNQITSFKGLDKLTSVQAIVLDHNQIKDIPFNSFAGCKSLKYLHMEHNRIACLPRLPHLNNLAALHLGYNRIQSLTDVHCLTTIGVKELTLVGNPAAYRTDYCKDAVNKLGTLQKLDGTDITAQILTLRGDLPALKFAINETTKKSEQKGVVVGAVPHGKLQYRPTSEFRKEDADDQFTDVTE